MKHGKLPVEHCDDCGGAAGGRTGKIDRFERIISVEGGVDANMADELIEIAGKCPVHRGSWLSSGDQDFRRPGKCRGQNEIGLKSAEGRGCWPMVRSSPSPSRPWPRSYGRSGPARSMLRVAIERNQQAVGSLRIAREITGARCAELGYGVEQERPCELLGRHHGADRQNWHHLCYRSRTRTLHWGRGWLRLEGWRRRLYSEDASFRRATKCDQPRKHEPGVQAAQAAVGAGESGARGRAKAAAVRLPWLTRHLRRAKRLLAIA